MSRWPRRDPRAHREAARSAALYGAIFARTGGYYPGVNAATLSLLAGDAAAARSLATEVLDRLAAAGDGSYYAAATEAEAQLLLGRPDAARAAVTRAAALHGGDYGAVATTRRQLRLVCDAVGVDAAVLAALAGPAVAHFCGHRIAAPGADGRFPAAQEASVARAIAEELDRRPVGIAYGSLASGADILWAEALLERGCELNVQLPFAREEFVRTSVAPSGGRWVERFERCLSSAATVGYATDDAFLGDDVLYRYGTELSMGLALLRARFLDAEVRQLAVWDGGPARRRRRHGDRRRHLATQRASDDGRRGRRCPAARGAARRGPDVAGAGRPRDAVRRHEGLLPPQRRADPALRRGGARRVRGGARASSRRVRAQHLGRRPVRRARNAESAADCALELQAAMGGIDLAAAGLPPDLSLRLSAHVGPVFPVRDPVSRHADVPGLPREPDGEDRAGHAAASRLRHGAVRGGARARGPGRPRLRLRRPHARREGLRPAAHVQAQAPRLTSINGGSGFGPV